MSAQETHVVSVVPFCSPLMGIELNRVIVGDHCFVAVFDSKSAHGAFRSRRFSKDITPAPPTSAPDTPPGGCEPRLGTPVNIPTDHQAKSRLSRCSPLRGSIQGPR